MYSTESKKEENSNINVMDKWYPPYDDDIKFNINGAFKPMSVYNGTGDVLWNTRNTWIDDFYKHNIDINDTRMELQALHQGLVLVIEHNLHITDIETDTSEVIKMVNSLLPLFTNIVNECKSALRRLEISKSNTTIVKGITWLTY